MISEHFTTACACFEDLVKLSVSLAQLKLVAESVLMFRVKVNQDIDRILTDFNKKKGSSSLVKLSTLLESDEGSLGKLVFSEHSIFKGVRNVARGALVQKYGKDLVLTNIRGDGLQVTDNISEKQFSGLKSKLLREFNTFDKIYNGLVDSYLSKIARVGLKVIDQLVQEVTQKASSYWASTSNFSWTSSVKSGITEILACVFAIWTLQNSEFYFQSTDSSSDRAYLLQPHSAQVIGLLRLLSVDDPSAHLANHFVQIGTGEGKSITLAMLSATLALLGLDVSCVCYSKYLSQRDYSAFSAVFDALHLGEHIHYGTFQELSEAVINQNGSVRELVENLVMKGTVPKKDFTKNRRPRVLIIDEVDVFFQKDFFGDLYTPAASLRSPQIIELIDYIWKNRETVSFDSLKSSVIFSQCVQSIPGWEFLIEEAAKNMLADLKLVDSDNYVIVQDRIGYKQQDAVIFDLAHGYTTAFAYLKEIENGSTVTRASFELHCAILLSCGSFSYAEIPQQFKRVLGVTGTLESLSEPEKAVIENTYNVKRKTIMPSVFGDNQLKANNDTTDVIVVKEQDYFTSIAEEIKKKIGTKRAVLVFFDTKEHLMEFFNSPAAVILKDHIKVFTEESTQSEKETLVKRTNSGQITLMTIAFGRGTDFVCRDNIVIDNGGVHVIQTFLSAEISEEIQIRGRTARQGAKGSYSRVLKDTELERFQITMEEFIQAAVDPINGQSKLLIEKREIQFKIQYATRQEFVSDAKKEHDIACAFVESLFENKLDSVRSYLGARNKGAAEPAKSRTIVLMDATGSMGNLLEAAKNKVKIMFERTCEILAQKKIPKDCFQLQFVVYRNYSSKDDILQVSPWVNTPEALYPFFLSETARGGQGNEAVEIGLWHVNNEPSVTQVILIGDVGPNTQQEVTARRSSYNWSTTRFSNPTYYKDEIEKLKQRKVPVHAFYVAKYAQASFQEMSTATGGKCEYLDVNSAKGADLLTDTVTIQVLQSVGGEELVSAYRAKFMSTKP